MSTYNSVANKPRPSKGVLNSLALDRLQELPSSKSGIIQIKDAMEKICSTFSLRKPTAWQLFSELSECGELEVIAFHGIKLKNKEKIWRC